MRPARRESEFSSGALQAFDVEIVLRAACSRFIETLALLYDLSVKRPKRTGNWTPDGKAERVSLQRDFRELTPAQRAEQVFELSRFMSQLAEAGHRRHLA